jgi:thermitase
VDNGARVINMSFGDTEASPMLEDIINYAGQAGMVMVAASGNYGNNINIYPAAFGPVLCVGAVNQNGVRASFSNYGTALDLMAPGVGIASTLMGSQYGTFQGGSGTSFACFCLRRSRVGFGPAPGLESPHGHVRAEKFLR